MAKKKKTQLKRVERGFATTSVPKKIVEAETEVLSTPATPTNDTEGGSTSALIVHDEAPAIQSAPHDDFDPEEVEKQSLQNLVDKLQEKTEKEIVRTIKTIESDRIFAKSLPTLELDPVLVERCLDLAREYASNESKKNLDEAEEKVVAKLAITYGVLRRLGFSEFRVEECLRAINGLDLDEAYDWLYLNCTESELVCGSQDETESRASMTASTPNSEGSKLPRTPSEYIAPPSPSPESQPQKYASKLDAKTPAFVPSMDFNVSAVSSAPCDASDPKSNDSLEMAVLKSRILASLGDVDDERQTDNSIGDDHHPNEEYVRIKMQITDLTTNRAPGVTVPAGHLRELQKQLLSIKKNYFFDEQEAEVLYEEARKITDAGNLDARLRGEQTALKYGAASLKDSRERPRCPKPSVSDMPSVTLDVFDEDGDDAEGGLLGILEMPTFETTQGGTIVAVRDMALPKHWSGRTPKVLLSEAVRKIDRYAILAYSIISGGSRAKRACLSVRWNGRTTNEWSMEDVACYDDGQAEQYISTVALHGLTFPVAEGFAASNSSNPGTQSLYRLLPPVYRDLWNELGEDRKAKTDALNRSVWGKLRSIAENKVDCSKGQVSVRGLRPPDEAVEHNSVRNSISHNDALAEQLASSFRMRESSPAYQEMLVHRDTLPIAKYRREIIQILNESQVLVLSGETGCGKSTQVPAFILEDQLAQGKPCKIYCTEPRRISAISLAQRVSRELGESANAVGTVNSLVGYSIRLESNTSKNTRLTFVTNGIALRMLQEASGQAGQGTAFDEITHIIIDEVHERSIESDFLLIVLKSLLEQRSDLKIILMSATVDAEKISNYFGGCPTLHVPGRTFPVEVRYLEDAIETTQWSISENSPYARRSHDKFYQSKAKVDSPESLAANDDEDSDILSNEVKLEKRYSPNTMATVNLLDERLIPFDLLLRLLEKICFEDQTLLPYSSAILIFMPGLGEIRRMNDILTDHFMFGSDNFKIYPLHSTLSSESQSAVFDPPPSGVRKIVIATNIAETGITIPDIACVIDSGKHREMRFDEKRQISRLVETFIARSNAAQRRGRAGRVRNGLCFHLFTKSRHDTQMVDNPIPEMMRLSLADLSLRIKIMKVKLGTSIEDVLSRALDPPTPTNIQRAISMLVEVRALTPSEEITPMGRLLSKLPTDVHLGKFLLIATLFRCLDPALTIAAALNSKSPFVTPFGQEQEADRAKASFKLDNSDFLTIHNAFSSWRRASANPGFVRKFCRQNFLSHQNLQQIEELRQQFLGYLIDASFIQVDISYIRELNRARYSRNRSRFVPIPQELDASSNNTALVNAALLAGLYPKVLVVDSTTNQMRTITNNRQASFHPSSVNFGKRPTDLGANYLVYFTLMHSKKLYAWETGPVDDMAMLLLCGEVDFKLASNTAIIDRKAKFQVAPKTNIALKFLRTQLAALLAHQIRGKVLAESQILWSELALMVLGKVKIEDENAQASIVRIPR